MKRIAADAAFTMAEMMISLTMSMLVVGALLLAAISLQRSLQAGETYNSSQADQRRLIDYLARDLRRSIGISATDSSGAPRTATGELPAISDDATLLLTLPGYYKSNEPTSADFDQPLPVVTTSDGVNYGTRANPARGVEVSYRRTFLPEENGVCFVREEAEAREIIVRKADDLHLRITIAPDGTSAVAEVWFRSSFSGVRPIVSTSDRIMLRNLRSDGTR